MKKLILTMALLVLAGCAPHVTHTVCVMPTVTTGYDTQNPIEVKQETVDFIGKKIAPEMEDQIKTSSNFVLERDCGNADYSLYSNIKEVNTGTNENKVLGWSSDSSRTFSIILDGRLKDNKTGKTLSEFQVTSWMDEMKNAVFSVSRDALNRTGGGSNKLSAR